MVKIGIIGQEKDPEVLLLKRRIEQRNKTAHVISFKEFPTDKKILLSMSKIIYDKVDLLSIDAFYNRQLGYHWPIPREKLTKKQWIDYYETYIDYLTNERETSSLRYSLIEILEDKKLVVNSQKCQEYHSLKPLEFYIFKKNNLPVPDFVVGNDIRKIKKFLSSHASVYINSTTRISTRNLVKKSFSCGVYKALAGGIHVQMAEEYLRNKTALSERPGIFQKFVKGKNIRVYAIGNEVIGAGELLSGPEVDSRIQQKGVRVVSIPKETKEIALKAMHLLGMHFSGIDFIYSEKENKYYLIECNPAPMFYGFEYMTKIPVSGKLAEYLIKKTKR